MLSTRIFGFFAAFAAAVSAAPVVGDSDVLTRLSAANITEEADRDLRNGEMLVYGLDGRTSIVTEKTWDLFLKTMNIGADTPDIDHDWLNYTADALDELDTNLDKRACGRTQQFVVDKSLRFVDWDVQMSPVVIGAGKGGIDITISKSYSIANSVSVSRGLNVNSIQSLIGVTYHVDYDQTWTTLSGNLIRGNVAAGETGVVITRPWTNRKYGRIFQGCIGSLRQVGTFMADSHEAGSYEGVSWVAGAITVCTKKQSHIPLSRCHGRGNFR